MRKTINKTLFWLKIILFYIITFVLGMIIPKKKDLVIIGSNNGRAFSGNGRALYEYISKNTHIEVYFFTHNKDLAKSLQEEGVRVLYSLSIRALFLSSRARTFAVTHGAADILGSLPLFNQNWFYLGHGTGTKSLGYMKDDLSIWERCRLLFMKKFHFISTSDFIRYMLCARHHVKPSKVHTTGYPRTDCLFGGADENKKITNILYAPTYRKGKIVKPFPFEDFEFRKLEEFLGGEDLDLYIRFHPGQYKKSKRRISSFFDFENIKDLSVEVLEDVQDFLEETDILVTDFSSISRDFLFLDRPIIYIMNGLDDLGGLALPIREEFAFCGYKVNTYEEFEDAVKEILEGKDKYARVRRFVRDLMYNHIDDKSSERVTKLIKKLA